jgi:hypothetical protein
MKEFIADATMDGITGKFRYVSPTCMPSSSTTRSPQGSVRNTGLLEFSLLGVASAQRSQDHNRLLVAVRPPPQRRVMDVAWSATGQVAAAAAAHDARSGCCG